MDSPNGVDNIGYDGREDPESPRERSHHSNFNKNIRLTNLVTNELAKLSQKNKAPSAAIVVRDAYKSYKSGQPVLKKFNMTVNAGSIYSLLGSSGCGKTTLLSCLVGLQKVDTGKVRVFGVEPGSRHSGVPGRSVGYMPQDLSLYTEFTIEESLLYFGRVYGMSRSQINGNMKFLLNLLDLPNGSRRIKTLSGGQKRRVSFALAIFHKATLLILDEPTVGVDPLLRESIWNYLRGLVVTRRITVIITTHYIEEARQSDTVGIMRNGRLLVEKNPEALMIEYRVPLLEQIVLQLCKKDNEDEESNSNPQGQAQGDTENPGGKTEDIMLKYHGPIPAELDEGISTNNHQDLHPRSSIVQNVQKDFWAMSNRLKALIIKNFTVLIRNFWFLLFVFVIPSMQIILICLAIGPDPKNLHIGVINNEFNDTSLEICQSVEGCAVTLSCKYLSLLPKENIKLIPYRTEEKARMSIEEGNLWGFLLFPANFSTNVIDRATSGSLADNETFENSRITFQMDMSNQEIGQTLKKIFFDVYQKFLAELAVECDTNPLQAELPLFFKTPVYGSDGTSFSEFLAPSVFLGLVFFFPLCSSGINYITEKKTGTLDRSLVSGVTNLEIMIAYLVSEMVVLLGQSCLAFFILTLVFHIPILGSIPLALSLAVLVGIGGMSMGFLISTVCKEEIEAVLLAIGSFFPNFLLAGMVWPIQAMPMFLQYVAYLLPCTLACESMRSIVSRGWGITHINVWLGFASTFAWICLYWTLTILIHQFKQRK